MKIIVGLGNPGAKYIGTRHNIGFRIIDLLASRWEIPVSERRPKVAIGKGRRADEEIILAKPRTFMNNSGEAIAYLSSRFGIKPHELLIVYDEMALPIGKLRLRAGGSDAGHNGIKSIISAIGTLEFPRVRVGIGKPEQNLGQISHVIGRFSKEEAPLMTQAVSTVADMIDTFIQEGIDKSMNLFN